MSRLDVLSVAVGALILLASLGFYGVSADNTQYLLGAYERTDAGFLVNDWFVRGTQSFHPLFEIYMAWWLGFNQLIAGLFIWYAVNLLWLSTAILVLIKYLGLQERLPLATIMVAGLLLVGVRYGWGVYEILTAQALPAYLAYPPALLSIVFLFGRRFFLSACLLSVTFLIHHGLGALLVLCMVGPIVVTLPRSRCETIRAGQGTLLVAAVILPVIFGTVTRDAGQVSDFAILFYGRSPQHFAVQFSDLQTHLSGLHIFATSMILAFTVKSRDARTKILTLIASIATLCLLGYLLLEIWYMPVFVRMFPYRAIPILVFFNACMIASVLFARSSVLRELTSVVLVALSSIVFQYNLPVSFLLLVTAAGLLLIRFLDRPAMKWEIRTALSLVFGVGALSLLLKNLAYPPIFFPEWPPSAQRVMATMIAETTPENAILVVPPWLNGIRISVDRAIVVNMKSFPVYGPEMVEWADRMRDVSGVDPRDAKQHLQKGANIWQLYNQGYQSRSLQDLAKAARKYNARFILVSTTSRFHWEAHQNNLRSLWSGSGYALYATPDGMA